SVKRDLGDGGHFGWPNIGHRQSEVAYKRGSAGNSFKNRLQGGIGHDVQVVQVTVLIGDVSSAAQHELSDERHIIGQDEMINDRSAFVDDGELMRCAGGKFNTEMGPTEVGNRTIVK